MKIISTQPTNPVFSDDIENTHKVLKAKKTHFKYIINHASVQNFVMHLQTQMLVNPYYMTYQIFLVDLQTVLVESSFLVLRMESTPEAIVNVSLQSKLSCKQYNDMTIHEAFNMVQDIEKQHIKQAEDELCELNDDLYD